MGYYNIVQQPEIPKVEIPDFYANKRTIGIAIIIQELANNYIKLFERPINDLFKFKGATTV